MISHIQIYKSTSTWLIIGESVQRANSFRILKISRNLVPDLISDDRIYSRDEINSTVEMAESTGMTKVCAAYGILGLIKFFNGYYMIVIKSRFRVGSLRGCPIYKIANTEMVYLPCSSKSNQMKLESKYLKHFQCIDLSADFYYTQGELNLTQIWPKCFQTDEIETKYCWNSHLIQRIPRLWRLVIIHGFAGSRRLSNNWNSPEVILIARRSSNYAGTRFNRRGQDFKGNVANDVETEQLVYQRGQHGEITSFVQHRGSIPIFWYQDMGSVPQKPPIELGHRDPWYQATGEHFKGLIGRYGSPIIAFNLVKKHSPGESDLGFEYKMAIEYLNQFLDEKIDWRWTDIAKLRKSGQFGADFNDECREVARHVGISSSKKKQNGVVRVNCVDCLDRTNLTQVNIGLVALQDQLDELGSTLSVGTDHCGSIFQKMFEEHGDIIGYQYGGSQLVHTLQSYRGKDPLASKIKDGMATISRYYSNTFSDYEKQMSLNVFLEETHQSDMNLNTVTPIQSINDYLCPPERTRGTDFLGDQVRKQKENKDHSEIPKSSFEDVYKPDQLVALDQLFSINLMKNYSQVVSSLDIIQHDEFLDLTVEQNQPKQPESIVDEDDIYIRNLPKDPENNAYISKKAIHEIEPISDYSQWSDFKPDTFDVKIQTSYEDFHLTGDQKKFWSEYVHSSII